MSLSARNHQLCTASISPFRPESFQEKRDKFALYAAAFSNAQRRNTTQGRFLGARMTNLKLCKTSKQICICTICADRCFCAQTLGDTQSDGMGCWRKDTDLWGPMRKDGDGEQGQDQVSGVV